MENCRRRQSSSVSVLLPTGDHNPSVSAGDGDSAAGIDSWQRVVKQRYLVSPSRFETPRSVPVTGDRAVAIFQLFYSSRGRSVFIQIDENLALLVILVCRSAAGDLSATTVAAFLRDSQSNQRVNISE